MNIGGTDIVVDGPGFDAHGSGLVVEIILALRAAWPFMVVDDLDRQQIHRSEPDEGQDASVLAFLRAPRTKQPGNDTLEFFVYRDVAAWDDWQNHGRTPENADAMVHILAGPSSTTIVVDVASTDGATPWLEALVREVGTRVARRRIGIQQDSAFRGSPS